MSLKLKHKSSQWKNRSYLVIILGILIGLFLINTTNLYFYVELTNTTLISSSNETKFTVTTRCTATRYALFMSDIVAATFRTVIPLILIIMLDFMIVSKLLIGIKYFAKTDKKSVRAHKRENHFTFTVIILGLFFMVFNIPVGVCYLVRNMYTGISAQNSYTSAVLDFIWQETHDTANFYYALFFFINFLFNSLFRRECFFILFEFYGKLKAKFILC
jgi:hypothetical protein